MATVVVGMSGGVDSSAAALLLKEQGYDVIGVTMRLWDPPAAGEEGGSLYSAAEDAGRVAAEIGIPHFVLDFREEFEREVIQYFVREYRMGRTPNPCIVCNRRVKWEALLSRCRQFGADLTATGHYARIRRCENGRYTVSRAASAAKDQTYALYRLTQEQLARTLMPVGEYEKEAVRELTARRGLPVAAKPDSQEICFIPDHDYASFIERYTGYIPAEGNYVDASGRILGKHRGITHYTVGQRKGLGIAFGKPVFVTEIRPETNEVVLGDNREIWSERLVCRDLNFMAVPGLDGEMEVTVKIRYSHGGASARIRRIGPDLVECRFGEPVRAVTPGQSAVFYQDGDVIGGGVICRNQGGRYEPEP